MNVQEILNINKDRKNRNKAVIEKIIKNIHTKIKYYATLKKESCFYIIPPIIEDTPLYDLENIIKEVYKVLDSEDYIVSAYPSGRFDIYWNEKLVEQKILGKKPIKLKKNSSFDFLANPKKTVRSFDQEVDDQVKKILKEQNKYKGLLK
jgi:hypothetical protein